LLQAYVFFKSMMSADEGNEKMVEIAGYVREGATAYLRQQYIVVAGHALHGRCLMAGRRLPGSPAGSHLVRRRSERRDGRRARRQERIAAAGQEVSELPPCAPTVGAHGVVGRENTPSLAGPSRFRRPL